MADIKVTGLPAGSAPFADTSVMLMSEDDTGFDSVKVTVAQMKTLFGGTLAKVLDNGFTMDAEQEIVFDASGTNKTFLSATGSSGVLVMDSSVVGLSGNGSENFATGLVTVSSTLASMGFNDTLFNFTGVKAASTTVEIQSRGLPVIEVGDESLGFYGQGSITRQVGVAVTASAIHAALVNLNLIGA